MITEREENYILKEVIYGSDYQKASDLIFYINRWEPEPEYNSYDHLKHLIRLVKKV